MRFSVLVEVKHKPGVADPQGATIERSLPTLGFDGIDGVTRRQGIRFTIDAADEAAAARRGRRVSPRFLTNPVIEDSDVRIEELVSG